MMTASASPTLHGRRRLSSAGTPHGLPTVSLQMDTENGHGHGRAMASPAPPSQLQTPGSAPASHAQSSTSAPSSRGPNKILFLDGIRGLAAFMVVSQHSGFEGGVEIGAAGVDIFFVLSAFLLTMIMEKKCRQLTQQGATLRQWGYAMLDYFTKRFLRVYPLFAVTAVLLLLLPDKLRDKYFKTHGLAHDYSLPRVLLFETEYRYHVFWTLPLEISYYFLIPVFVLATIKLRRVWWVPLLPLYVWIVHQGLYEYRTSHAPLKQHLPTFLSGSVAAIVYVKADGFMKQRGIELRKWHKLLLRVVEYAVLGLIMSIYTKGMYFHWFFENPVEKGPGGFPFVSVLVTIIIVLEMLSPSELGGMFEWNFLRYWGKISFSAYLLHSFVVFTERIREQKDFYDRYLSIYLYVMVGASISYYLVEYPSQLLAVRLSKALNERGGLSAPATYAALKPTQLR